MAVGRFSVAVIGQFAHRYSKPIGFYLSISQWNDFKGNTSSGGRVGSTSGRADQLMEFLWLSFWKILHTAYISCVIILLQTN